MRAKLNHVHTWKSKRISKFFTKIFTKESDKTCTSIKGKGNSKRKLGLQERTVNGDIG